MATKPDRNIVVTGFMGTGKSSVGQALARCLDRPFIDTDEVIVEQAGKSIPEIFAQDGEVIFRHHEQRICRYYAAQRGLVIATGGGMLVDRGNREVMLASSFVVCLRATKAAIRERLAGAEDRPLFSGDWETLYDARAAAYDLIPNQVDTTQLSTAAVVKEVKQIWEQSFT